MNVILDGIDISGGVESGNFWSEEALGWYGYLSLRHLRPLPPSEPATATSRAIYEAHDVALRAIGRTVPIELARAEGADVYRGSVVVTAYQPHNDGAHVNFWGTGPLERIAR